MNRVNFYKRFCVVFIILAMIFCGGAFVYAHSPELEIAEMSATENPTIETLGRLCILYQQDVEKHKEKGEISEAQKSKASMLWVRSVQLEIIARNYQTPGNWENVVQSLDDTAAFYEAAGYAENAAAVREKAALARAYQAEITVRNKPTPENWENTAMCWDKVADLFRASRDSKNEAKAKEQAVWARAEHATTIAKNDHKPENFENEALHWEEAADLFKAAGDAENAAYAREKAALARAHQAEMTAHNKQTPENWKNTAMCWDKVADLFRASGNLIYVVTAQAQAAEFWAKYNNMIALYDRTPESHENEARWWDKAADLFAAAGNNEKAANARQNAIWARIWAKQART